MEYIVAVSMVNVDINGIVHVKLQDEYTSDTIHHIHYTVDSIILGNFTVYCLFSVNSVSLCCLSIAVQHVFYCDKHNACYDRRHARLL